MLSIFTLYSSYVQFTYNFYFLLFSTDISKYLQYTLLPYLQYNSNIHENAWWWDFLHLHIILPFLIIILSTPLHTTQPLYRMLSKEKIKRLENSINLHFKMSITMFNVKLAFKFIKLQSKWAVLSFMTLDVMCTVISFVNYQ